jgi:hypothetical protein
VQPTRYAHAVACHGQESDCESKDSPDSSPELKQREIQRLIDDYKAYPEPLRPSHLATVFTAAIKKDLMPYVLAGPHCAVAEPLVLTPPSKTVIQRTSDNLLVYVTLQIQDATNPRIALFSVTLGRLDPDTGKTMQGQTGSIFAIPLSLSDSDISHALDQFVLQTQIGPNTSTAY